MPIEIPDPCLTGSGPEPTCEGISGFVYTKYPCNIDSSNELPISVDNQTPVKAEVVNRLREATIAIESELGINPSGTFTTVRARLDAYDVYLCTLFQQMGSGEIGSSLSVQEDGVEKLDKVKVLNFTGTGVTVTATDSITTEINISNGSVIVQVQETKAVTVNGQTAFTLSLAPDDDTAVEMFLNGTKLEHGVSYTSVGTSLTYSGIAPLVTTDIVEFWYLATGSNVQVKQETIPVTFNGQAVFALSLTPQDPKAVKMYFNGLKQQHGVDYTVAGQNVTYTGTPSLLTTDVIEFWYIVSSGGGGGGGGTQTLSQTLALGNTTGGNDIIVTVGDSIKGSAGNLLLDSNVIVGTGYDLQAETGNLSIASVVDMNAQQVKFAADPTDPQDLVTLSFLSDVVDGYGAGGGTLFEEFEGNVTTLNNTATVCGNITIPVDNTTINIQAMVSARDQTSGNAAIWTIVGGFERTSGTVLQVGTTSILSEEKEDVSFAVDFSITGTTVNVVVTGHITNQVKWKTIAQVVRVV